VPLFFSSTSSFMTTKLHVQWVSDTHSSGGNLPGREANHFYLSSAEVNNEWSYLTTPHIRLHGVQVDNFTLTCVV